VITKSREAYEVDFNQTRSEPPWLDVIAAARYLNRSPRFMRRLVAERRITHYKHGRFVAFRKTDLDQWATSECREAVR
jgi:excisionase family DNA binding protein